MLVPELRDKKGAIINVVPVPSKDDWIVDLKVRIANDEKTLKGGAGLALYYLQSINQEEIGNGVFGYTRNFNGLSVFMNSLF